MNIGDIELANLCVGDQEVKAYLGTEEVWSVCPDGPQVTVYRMDDSVTVDRFCDGLIPSSQYQYQTDIVAVEIGEGITGIGEYAFCDIGDDFSACTLPDTLEYIGPQAFQHAGVLEWTIPESVTGIGWNAFNTENYGQVLTQSMTFMGNTPPVLLDDFENITLGQRFPIYVPCEAESDYQQEYSYYSGRISCY